MARPRGSGGPAYHKDGCMCNYCTAQRRKAEALAQSVGPGGAPAPVAGGLQPREVINADLPTFITHGRTMRDRIAQFIALRNEHPDWTHAEIAKKLGILPRTLYGIIYRATKEGWLRFEDPVQRIENEIIPKVVDNLSRMLDEGNERVTIETAKGTIFRKYQEEQGISDAAQTILALKIEQPDGTETKILTGRIVGRPKAIPTTTDSES
jgi:hypothetical protein